MEFLVVYVVPVLVLIAVTLMFLRCVEARRAAKEDPAARVREAFARSKAEHLREWQQRVASGAYQRRADTVHVQATRPDPYAGLDLMTAAVALSVFNDLVSDVASPCDPSPSFDSSSSSDVCSSDYSSSSSDCSFSDTSSSSDSGCSSGSD